MVPIVEDAAQLPTATPEWTLPWAVTDKTTILNTDPWRFSVQIQLGDEKLVVELDIEGSAVTS